MAEHSSAAVDVAVVGGGVIGLAVAWRAAQRGYRVCVLDRGTDRAAHVAAGMLAPVTEADVGERALLELGLRSAAAWPGFADELARAAGVDGIGYRRCGALAVARDRDEAEALERELLLRDELGLDVERLRPSAARALEPALAPTIRLALHAPHDHAVDPRRLVAALRVAARAAGVQLRDAVEVERVFVRGGDHRGAGVEDVRRGRQQVDTATNSVLPHPGERGDAAIDGVFLRGGERVDAARVVIAAGAWAGCIDGLPAGARVPVRPVKGQILRLRDPAGPGLLERIVRFEGGYLVPRGDGRYVLGATMEERGFDTTVTAGGIYELLRDAGELVPGISELVIEESAAGLRPGTPDNAPLLGPSATVDGLHWATGHHRNGILLAPVTAQLVAGGLDGEPLPAAFAPGRFAAVAEAIA